MAKIRLLDSETINQIAAGEVVERPASVVKELVENAIDANATAIAVEIKDGGIGFIRITDNGDGIDEEQVPIAFSRHATSKIRTVEDLLSVSSLGFRGEALSSIAAVSRVELFTKTRDSITGVHYVIEGGEEKELSETGIPDGTTFVVRNLFYNTPARRKFLKTATSEGSQIQELMVQFALAHPEIAFKFTNQNQVKLQTGGQHKLKEIIYEVCGRDITRELLEIDVETDMMKISGYLGKPVIGRGNRSFEHYFINGRYIKSRIVANAIEDAYQGFLMQHRYPFTVLHLTMPSHLLDVNVHPSKMELRFSDNQAVYEQLKNSIAGRLRQEELIPDVTIDKEKETAVQKTEAVQKKTGDLPQTGSDLPEDRQRGPEFSYPKNLSYISYASDVSMPEPFEKQRLSGYEERVEKKFEKLREQERETEQLKLFDHKLLDSRNASKVRIVGQVFATYWIVEFEDNMYIIDQHAAHEKVNYERMREQLKNKEMTSQQVSPPIMLTLTAAEEEKLNAFLPYFEKLGYEISSFGGMDYMVSGVPGNLYGLLEKDLLLQMLDEIDIDTGRNNETMILEKLASMSCKAAVKGGMKLSYREAEALFDELLHLENPYHCPHGRPVIISMSRQELEKKFKRIL